MRKEMYPSVAENGIAGAEHKAAVLREMYPHARVTIVAGPIPRWGNAIPTSSTYGKTELGFQIIVEHPDSDDFAL